VEDHHGSSYGFYGDKLSKAFVIGNGASITPELLESLGENTWAVNRIWKIFDRTDWRPKNYVRAEVPSYNVKEVIEDMTEMGKVACVIWYQAGFQPFLRSTPFVRTRCEKFKTCDGKEAHDWHLPLICGYGTVVHIAAQLAVREGATEVEFVGCDLGTEHFYPDVKFTNEELASKAHAIAERMLNGN